MPGFVKLVALDELAASRALEVEHDGRVYALFQVDGAVFAMDGICPHQGGPLARGEVAQGAVTCPWHGWRFDLASGQSAVHARVVQPTFEVQVRGGDVWVDVP